MAVQFMQHFIFIMITQSNPSNSDHYYFYSWHVSFLIFYSSNRVNYFLHIAQSRFGTLLLTRHTPPRHQAGTKAATNAKNLRQLLTCFPVKIWCIITTEILFRTFKLHFDISPLISKLVCSKGPIKTLIRAETMSLYSFIGPNPKFESTSEQVIKNTPPEISMRHITFLCLGDGYLIIELIQRKRKLNFFPVQIERQKFKPC